MTATDIKNLYNYDPFPNKVEIPVEDIENLYLPFDKLTGLKVESKILEDFQRQSIGKFYGLIGDSGYGKSSFLNYLLTQLSKNNSSVFCIKMNEFIGEVSNEPKNLLTHILRKIYRMVLQFNKLTDEQKTQARMLLANRYSFTSEKGIKTKAQLDAWFNVIPMILGFKGSVGIEIEKQTKIVLDGEKSLEELIDFLNQAVKILQQEGVKHVVLMFDETDKILAPNTNEPSVKYAIAFFVKMLPVLSKINCSYVFVLNSQYNTKAFASAVSSKYFDRIISMPKIDKKKIRKIIEKRTQAVCKGVEVEKIWDEEALQELAMFYGKTSLRHLTTACKYSIEKARVNASNSISVFHAKDAISEVKSMLTVN